MFHLCTTVRISLALIDRLRLRQASEPRVRRRVHTLHVRGGMGAGAGLCFLEKAARTHFLKWWAAAPEETHSPPSGAMKPASPDQQPAASVKSAVS
jgi:hypothetical protein